MPSFSSALQGLQFFARCLKIEPWRGATDMTTFLHISITWYVQRLLLLLYVLYQPDQCQPFLHCIPCLLSAQPFSLVFLTLASHTVHMIYTVSASTIPLFWLYPFLCTSTWWRSAEKTQLINIAMRVGLIGKGWTGGSKLNAFGDWATKCVQFVWCSLEINPCPRENHLQNNYLDHQENNGDPDDNQLGTTCSKMSAPEPRN